MNAQSVIAESRLAHVRELRAEVARLREENARLREECGELAAHLDLALLAAEDLRGLGAEGTLLIVDGWNQILGANRTARDRGELVEAVRRRLAERPADRAWIVFDGAREGVTEERGIRISYTGGAGPHRADRFVCDYLRMARFRGDAGRIAVVTDDRDFARDAVRLGARVTGLAAAGGRRPQKEEPRRENAGTENTPLRT